MQRISRRKEAAIVDDIKRGFLTRAEIAQRYGVSVSCVSSVAKRNKVASRQHNVWTEAEIEFLCENYGELGPRGVADRLERHRNYGSVCHKAKELGLSTSVGPYGKQKTAAGSAWQFNVTTKVDTT